MKPNSVESQALHTVAVVGAGASGTLAAIRLLETPDARAGRLRVILIERRALVGRGLAYGTDAPFHVLNVRQNRMSVYPENGDHFARFVARAYPAEMTIPYQPRSRYAEYLAATLGEARRSAPASSFSLVTGVVEKFGESAKGSLVVSFTSGKSLDCDRLVIATGYASPETPAGLRGVRESVRYVADPWASPRAGPIGPNERILIVGSGLTTVDYIMARVRSGHLAPIDVISRRGLSPLPHPVSATEFSLSPGFSDRSVREVLRSLREASAKPGVSWADVIDGFRSEVPRIWEKWPDSEKRRFLRHCRTYWATHRHRVAPEIYREWDLYVRAGKVRVEAGRVLSAEEAGDGFRVQFEKRGGEISEKRFDRIVNCTPANPDLGLVEGHAYRRDPLELGVPTDAFGRPYLADGNAEPRVFFLGPFLRTRYWEMTAVPDLRVQAKRMADALVAGLGR